MLDYKIPKGIKKNISLKKYTTFRIGGRAKFFFEARNKKDIISILSFSLKNKIPFFVLGGGSNLLVSDEGFSGLIIKMQNKKYKIERTKIIAEAGVKLGELVNASAKAGLSGLEWAIGIPGTLGGAIRGNAGAFGKSMADIVESVEVLKIKKDFVKRSLKQQKLKIEELKNKDCRFQNKSSIFKKSKNLIILSAIVQLQKKDKREIRKKMKEYLDYRKKTQPLSLPSAGCIFVNSKGLSAGEIIEKSGLKGKRIGDVEVSEKHANFIVNLGQGKAKDVFRLIKFVEKEVKEKFKITLEREIEFLGSFPY